MRKREKNRDPESTGVHRGRLCAHTSWGEGEIRATGSVPVFGIGGKDKQAGMAAQREARRKWEC